MSQVLVKIRGEGGEEAQVLHVGCCEADTGSSAVLS